MRVAACLLAVIGVLAGASAAPASFPFRPVADGHPVWSPDDKAIAYVSTEGPPSIFTPVDGRTTVVPTPPDTTFSSFSPDWSVVAGVRQGSQPALVVFRPDGTGVRTLDDILVGPTWAPNGQLLAYTKRDGETGSLYTIRADGSARHRIAVAAGGNSVAWAPDSSQLAFAQGGDLVIARSDGNDVRRITVPAGRVWDAPGWSPDGRRIAILVGDSLRPQIAIVSVDGTPTLAVEPRTAISLQTRVSWSPDSSRLLYSEGDATNKGYGAYEIELATGAQRQVALFGLDASYSHDGTKVVFGGLAGVKDPPPVPMCVGVGIWVVPQSGGTPARVTSRCNNPPFTIFISAPPQLLYGEGGQLSGYLLPGFGPFVRGSAKPCGGTASPLVTAAVDGFWSRPVAPHVTTVYTAASDIEETRATIVVRPRLTLRQTGKLRFEVKVLAARSLVGASIRVNVGRRSKQILLQHASKRGASVTTSALFRLKLSEVRPWLEGLVAALPARRCLASGVSNVLNVSR